MKIEMMPEEYKGKITKSGGYTKNAPREWTEKEIEFVQELLDKGYTTKEIAISIDRSVVSTSIKIKRLGKKNRTYNTEHIDDKYKTNLEFIEYIKPKTILDVYAGMESFYNGKCEVVSNDKNEQANTDFHLDALRFLCKMYYENQKFDIVDLDPFGSSYDCFDLAIKTAKSGLVVTFGELGHKRFKRLDYVSRYYGINTMEEFTLDNLIEHIQMIGRRNKKDLIVYSKKSGEI